VTDPHPEQLPAAEQQAVVPYVNDWRWNNQATVPPISGQVRTDLGTWLNATHVYLSKTTDGGLDVGALLLTISPGSNLDVQHRTDPTRSARYTVKSAPVTQATYVDVPVTYVQSAGTIPTSNTVVTVTLSLVSQGGQSCTWRMFAAREPNRFYIEANCQHGRVTETIATTAGWPAGQTALVETVAMNLRRRMGCQCSALEPLP
jgi:hypothetical protein